MRSCWRVVTSSWDLMGRYKKHSSAKRRIPIETQSVRSFINTRSKRGSSTVPCKTPEALLDRLLLFFKNDLLGATCQKILYPGQEVTTHASKVLIQEKTLMWDSFNGLWEVQENSINLLFALWHLVKVWSPCVTCLLYPFFLDIVVSFLQDSTILGVHVDLQNLEDFWTTTRAEGRKGLWHEYLDLLPQSW